LCDRLENEDGSGDVWFWSVCGDLGRYLFRRLVGCCEGGPGFFDDLWWSAGVRALGEFGGGEEFGVAGGAVAGAEEVEKVLLADGKGIRGG